MLADLVVHQIEAVDHYQAKSVEQCHHREQQRVSVGAKRRMARCADPNRVRKASP